MTILVCGSRGWTDQDKIADVLAEYTPKKGDLIVMHGDARGADRLAAEVAGIFGYEVRTFPAQWRLRGRRAGIERNILMLDQEPDEVIAFYDGSSAGTRHTIDEARRRGIPVRVITAEDE